LVCGFIGLIPASPRESSLLAPFLLREFSAVPNSQV
jgi:hypothetical protein